MKRYPSWIAGLTYENRGRYALRHLQASSQLTLRREPQNQHDPDAVAVTFRRHTVGYIPERHHWVAHAIDEGRDITCHVDKIEAEGWWLWRRARFVGLVIEVH